MHDPQRIIFLATLLGGAGIWLMLPRGPARGRGAGAVLTAAGWDWGRGSCPLGNWTADGLFYLLAGVTTVAALATVTFRNPVYCAIWFGMTLTGTAGLFLFTGAEFLAVATVVVYAGAILVTFLFLLMLAQPEGDAPYDRRSWEALLAAATGATLVGILTMTLVGVFGSRPVAARAGRSRPGRALGRSTWPDFGGELFGRHLIAVEVAGTLLLAAVVGAAVIVAQGTAAEREEPSATVPRLNRRIESMHQEIALLHDYLAVGAMLFGIGLVGFLSRRNMIVMFLSAEMMLQGVSVSLVAWSRFHNDFGGQMLVVFIIAVAACEAAIALAMILMLFQRSGKLDIAAWQQLREANQPPWVEEELPPQAAAPLDWPQLPPAGVQPEIPKDELQRPRPCLISARY